LYRLLVLCTVFTGAAVDPGNDPGLRGTFESALAGDTPHQAIDAFDVSGAADGGLPTPLATSAYFSNGTRSSASALSPPRRWNATRKAVIPLSPPRL